MENKNQSSNLKHAILRSVGVEGNDKTYNITLSHDVTYFGKVPGYDYRYCSVTKFLILKFPDSQEGKRQALVTNYIMRKKLMSYVKEDLLQPFEVPPVDVDNDNSYEYDIKHVSACVTTVLAEFPIEIAGVEVSFPDFVDCYYYNGLQSEYRQAIQQYESLCEKGDEKAILSYEKSMQSLATIEYQEDVDDPVIETEDKNDLLIDSYYYDFYGAYGFEHDAWQIFFYNSLFADSI